MDKTTRKLCYTHRALKRGDYFQENLRVRMSHSIHHCWIW